MNRSHIEDLLINLAKELSQNDDDQTISFNENHDDHDHFHDHNENELNDQNQSPNVAKVTAMVVLFTASTLCGSIPFLLNKWFKWTDNNTNARSATVVKCLLYFGGGVLLCTTFLHLLPEVNENIEELQNSESIMPLSFHLAELLTCLGFFAMFLVEELIHAYIHRHQKALNDDQAAAAFQRGRSIRDSFLIRGNRKSLNNIKTDENLIKTTKSSGLSVQDLIGNDAENQKYNSQEIRNSEILTISNVENHQQHQNIHQHEHNDHQQDQIQNVNNNNNINSINSTINTINNHQHHQNHDIHHGHSHLPTNIDEDMIVSSLRGLLVVLALSLHELFEGLAVGLESSATNVWYMFGAVSAHKLVLAFCVGVELIVTRTRLWLSIVYVVTFAIVSPIGIGIGILVSNENSAASAIPSAILQGLATGTLLYVVFFEILSKERSGLIAYVAFVTGFIVMFGLQFATGHEHTHSHGGHTHNHDDHDHNHEHNHDKNHADDEHNHIPKSLEAQIRMLRDVLNTFNNKSALSDSSLN